MKLEDLKSEQRVLGVEPTGAVKILYVKLGVDSAEIAYQLADGTPRMQTLFREHEAKLRLEEGASPFLFDGDPKELKLAIEAQRIQLAHLFDPMMAVHSSDVEPLPHQIAAVYRDMLPRQPLRFLLADDPGAGKTIMAGLLIRELLLRGDLERCLVVAPGSLVEQWQTEMSEKFGLAFALLSHELAERSQTGNPFKENDLLIARLDQLSRNGDWRDRLQADGAGWDLVVVDEAHKMSAHFFGKEVKYTKRYELGQLLGNVTRHLLLMTATPHNGKEEDFRLFMSLIDSERFTGKLKSQEKVDASDLMRRMIKEELRRFDGSRLFPKRVASTRPYDLSPEEQDLYDAVTEYVKTEMGRAEKLDGKRRGAVGFALTVLQRRLASSPLAIYKSLERRRRRLEEQLEAHTQPARRSRAETILELFGGEDDGHDIDDDLDELDDDTRSSFEDEAVSSLTTARKPDELRVEIAILKKLEAQAKALVASEKDRKRDELSELLCDDELMRKPDGSYRKLIVFTEHKDTLDYLVTFIRSALGAKEMVVEIHGSTRRQDRLDTQDAFRQDDKVRVLVATDAACEGVNLQNASLLINYDLPWNPNRIEQRFGRIHRIGQTEVCRMWNLVAMGTREGHVFHRLLQKLEVEAEALEGRVFDVLGEAFEERSLRDMLMDAIRGGDDPQVKERIDEQLDHALDHEHLKTLMNRQALSAEVMSTEEIHRVREDMERAEARKLAPHYLYAFFHAAFERLGGEMREREKGRYQVPHVPAKVRKSQAIHGGRRRVLERYERVTFKRDLRRIHGKPPADLMHPGHPLMAAVIRETLSELGSVLERGAVLIDPTDDGKVPRVLCLLEHTIKDANRVASQRIQTVEIDPSGQATSAGYASHLDYEPPPEDPKVGALIQDLRGAEWISCGIDDVALAFASSDLAPKHLRELRAYREHHVQKAKEAVHTRLTQEIHRLSKRAKEAERAVRAGKQPSGQDTKDRRAVEELKVRLERRIEELDAQLHLASQPPRLLAAALVLPVGLVREVRGEEPPTDEYSADPAARSRIEQIAVDAVLAAERALDNTPTDVGKEKIGWDVSSYTKSGALRCIEVKGRQAQATTVTVTANEVRVALNKEEKFILALVLVDGETVDGPHYAQGLFHQELELNQPSVQVTVKSILERAKAPHEVFTPDELRTREVAQ